MLAIQKSGYVFTYGGGAISWRSKLQEWTTLSTIEAGYIAASEAMKEAIWLHLLSVDFSATSPINHLAPTIYCDSQSMIRLIRNHVYHAKTKHIEVRFHHIRELVIEKKLEVRKIDTKLSIGSRRTTRGQKPESDTIQSRWTSQSGQPKQTYSDNTWYGKLAEIG